MANRTRNFVILGLVAALLVAAVGVIATKPTRLGLDLKGGVELVYQARPTPQVPKVTPQAISDAVNTIRKRTDALGVSEPEIQQAGSDQISIGLPAVKNANRAEQQVGTTAQLQFYDWEPNLIGPNGKYLLPDPPNDSTLINSNPAILGLFAATEAASKAQPKAEPTDIPPGGPSKEVVQLYHGNQKQIQAYYDRKNDTSGTKYYVFAPGKGNARQILRPGEAGLQRQGFTPGVNDANSYYTSCQDLANDYLGATPTTGPRARGPKVPLKTEPKGTACSFTLKQLGNYGPPAGSTVVKVPQGITLVKAETPRKGQKNSSASKNTYYVLEDDSELSGSDITDPKQNFDPQTQEPDVTMSFTNKGRKAFARATKREADRGSNILLPPGTNKQAAFQNFAITLDNQIVSLANISFIDNPEGIPGDTGAQISGLGGISEAQDLANNLRIGALPVTLKLISKTQVSSTLGKQALHQGLIAGAVGLLLTLMFLLIFYRFLGIVAGVALLIYGVLLFGLVKLIPITLTLPGIAGLVLTLGVAADANIVIFERIKEEAREGRSIPAAIAGGYSKAVKTIADANAVTLFVAFILFTLATAGVKGFAFTLGVGTLVSLFTAVLATSAILGSMSRRRILRSRWAINPGPGRRWHFDFMGNSRWFFSMSGVIILAGAIAISTLGLKLGIDFESGTRITTPVQRAATVQQVRNALGPLGYGDAKIQSVNDPDLGKYVFQITTRKLEPNRVNKVQSALDQKFGVNRADFSASSVGPTFGQQIARTALIAIIASLIVISIYIGLRFEFKFAVPVLIALAHDLLITSGVYALTGREVTADTVAALLTILGFSLYDTIIVFDRIRENVPRMPRATFTQIVNRSMSEVLTRSLATSLSTLLPILALLLFGGETLKDFGFALLVGVASGAYSSIFIASPVLTHWKEREPLYRRRRRVVMEDNDGVVPAYAEGTLTAEEEPAAAAGRRRPRPAPSRATPAAAKPEPAVDVAATAVREPPPEPQPEPEPPAADGGEGRGDDTQSARDSVRAKAEERRRQRKQQRKRHGRR